MRSPSIPGGRNRSAFDQRNEDFVSEWTRLAELRVRPNRDPFFADAAIKMYLTRARRGAFLVVAEERACDAEQVVFHVELAGTFVSSADRCRLIVFSDIASLYAALVRTKGSRWGEAVDTRGRPEMHRHYRPLSMSGLRSAQFATRFDLNGSVTRRPIVSGTHTAPSSSNRSNF